MLRLIAATFLALLPWAAGNGFEAATCLIDIDGHVLSVDIATDPYDPQLQGVRVQDQAPGGQISSQIIPSTLDSTLDTSPAISMRPGGAVVVAWARSDGYDSELALAVRDAANLWRPHITLTSNNLNDDQPRLLFDSQGIAQIVWWGNGLGGPIFLQGFDPDTGIAVGSRHRPLEPPGTTSGKKLKSPDTWDSAGGLDDPGVPTTGARASAIPCGSNPAAVPDHGVFFSCGRPAAFQLTDCRLTVGVQLETGTWTQTTADLSTVNLAMNSPREIMQSLADAYCPH